MFLILINNYTVLLLGLKILITNRRKMKSETNNKTYAHITYFECWRGLTYLKTVTLNVCCLYRLELPFWVTDLFTLYNWSDKMPKGVQIHPHDRCVYVCLCGLKDASTLSRTELGKSKIIVSGGFTFKSKRCRYTRTKLKFIITFLPPTKLYFKLTNVLDDIKTYFS